jgi:hypothetical protein
LPQRMSAKERLAEALVKAGASPDMVAAARRGCYDDFESESATPIIDLVRDSKKAGLDDIATRAMNGEFDAE